MSKGKIRIMFDGEDYWARVETEEVDLYGHPMLAAMGYPGNSEAAAREGLAKCLRLNGARMLSNLENRAAALREAMRALEVDHG